VSEHWREPPFLVGVPAEADTFFRLTRSSAASDADFRPDSDVRDRYGFEDHCSYRAISVWQFEEQAREHARDINRNGQGTNQPPFTHVVAFRLKPRNRHACSDTGPPEGHFTVWAEPGVLASRSERGVPIEPEGI
jgi:hypothetical protein